MSCRIRPVLAVAAFAGALASMIPAFAETNPAPDARPEMVDRFYRGRGVINAAAQAAGGAQALRGMNAISFEIVGEVSNDIQGYAAERIGDPARDGEQTILNRIDFAGARFNQLVRQTYLSGYDSAFASIWREGTQYAVRYVPRDFTKADGAPSPFSAGGAVAISARFAPPLILQRALQNFRSATFIGEGTAGGETADIVEFSFDEVTRFRIFVTRTGSEVRRVETIAPDPVAADVVSVVEFSGGQTVAGLVFPTNATVTRRGSVLQKVRLSNISVNPTFTDADFLPPAEFSGGTAPSPQLRTTQIAGRVYEVSGLAGGTYQAPFVVMDDFVVAYEAPLGVPQTRQVIAEIRKVAGEKPIRYLVISHFHADHAGGVGAYVEAGATIVSSAANEAVLTTYAASNRPQFQGQEGPIASAALRFQAAPEDGFDITDRAGGRIRVIDFARTTHVDHMLALFEPKSGVFMGADHHINAVRWNASFERTAKWVRSTPEVATVLGVHDRPMTRDEFLAAAKRRRNEARRDGPSKP